MRNYLIIFLLLFALKSLCQIDTGTYHEGRSYLILKDNNNFKYCDRPSSCYLWGNIFGKYTVNSDTLILTDALNKEYAVIRNSFYFVNKKQLIFIKETFFNSEKYLLDFRKEHNIPESSVLSPGGLNNERFSK